MSLQIDEAKYKAQYKTQDEYIGILRESFKGIYENKYFIVLFSDSITGDILDVNAGASEFYGYSKKRFCRKKISDISVSDGNSYSQNIARQIDDKSCGRYYSKHCLANGDVRDVEVLEGPVFIKDRLIICNIIYDITDRVKKELINSKIADRYMELVEFSPVGIMVVNDGIIKYVNTKAIEIYGYKDFDMLIGKSFREIVIPGMQDNAMYYIASSGVSEKRLPSCVFKIVRNDGSVIECEFDVAQILYDGRQSTQLVFRDITENRKDLKRASGVQKHRQTITFPLNEFARFETIYSPANDVSGDFFQLHKINEKKIIGIIGDVAGKGITAALDTTALKVMFYDGIAVTHDPIRLLRFLNMEVAKHMENDYVAACCFTFDFDKNVLNIAGGGINQFICSSIGSPLKQITMTGTYLGMFDGSNFENREIHFESGDRLFFYTDGFDSLLENEMVCEKCAGMHTIEKLKKYLSDMLLKDKGYRDDATMMIVEII